MKTKELIKLLQEADPSGECHVDIDGKIPFSVYSDPGYWDGPYKYLDGDKNFVTSTEGDKVVIDTMDIDFFVVLNYKRTDSNNLENIKKKFIFNLGYSDPNQKQERIDGYLREVEECWKDENEVQTTLYDRSYNEMVQNALKGWKWFQNKDVDKNEKPNNHRYYTWLIYDERGKVECSNVWNTESIQDSGDWKKLDNNKKKGYYEWIYIR